jgi:hypothetical protein
MRIFIAGVSELSSDEICARFAKLGRNVTCERPATRRLGETVIDRDYVHVNVPNVDSKLAGQVISAVRIYSSQHRISQGRIVSRLIVVNVAVEWQHLEGSTYQSGEGSSRL